MAVNVATLEAKLKADTRDFNAKLKTSATRLDKLDKSGRKASKGLDSIKKAALGVGVALGAMQLGRFAANAVQLAVSAEEAASAFATTFGPAVDEVATFVDDFGNKAGLAEFELEQLLATTGAVTQGIGFTEEASADLSISMATLAGDVASFSNAAGGTEAVLRALQSAINGEREALKTYGLAVSEVEVTQRALTDTDKAAVDQLTRQDKALATVALAYEKAGKMVGDLDRTQDSAANTMRELGAQWKEAQVTLGKELLPVLEEFLPIIEDLIPAVGELAVEVFGLVGELARLAEPILKVTIPAISFLASTIEDAGRIIGPEAFLPTGSAEFVGGIDAAASAQLKFNAAIAAASEQSTEIRVALSGYGDAMGRMEGVTSNASVALNEMAQGWRDSGTEVEEWAAAHKQAIEDFPAAIEVFEDTVAGVAAAREGLQREAGAIVDIFGEVPKQIETSNAEMLEQVRAQSELATVFRDNVQALRNEGFDFLADQLEAGGLEAAGKAQDFVDDLESAFEMENLLREPVADELSALEDELELAEQTLFDAAKAAGAEIPLGIKAGLRQTEGDAVAAVTRLVSKLEEAASTSLESRSPSELFARIAGRPISEGIAQGILDAINEPVSAMQQVMDRVQAEAESGMDAITASISAGFSAFNAAAAVGTAQTSLAGLEAEAAGLPTALAAAQQNLMDERVQSRLVTNTEQLAIENAQAALDRLIAPTTTTQTFTGTAIVDGVRQFVQKTVELTTASTASAAAIGVAQERLQAAIEASTASTRDEDAARKELNRLLERQLTIDDDILKAQNRLTQASWSNVNAQIRLIAATNANTIATLSAVLAAGGTAAAPPSLIDFAFDTGIAQGLRDYWKTLAPTSPEWVDFWTALLQGAVTIAGSPISIEVNGAGDPATTARAVRSELVKIQKQNATSGIS